MSDYNLKEEKEMIRENVEISRQEISQRVRALKSIVKNAMKMAEAIASDPDAMSEISETVNVAIDGAHKVVNSIVDYVATTQESAADTIEAFDVLPDKINVKTKLKVAYYWKKLKKNAAKLQEEA